MQHLRRISYLASLVFVAACAAPITAWAQAGPPKDRFIVVLKADRGIPEDVAADVARRTNGRVGYVYKNALRGFSITMPRAALAGVARNPRVAYVEEDRPVSVGAQTLPTGVDRIFQPTISDPHPESGSMIDDHLSINGVDDWRMDVDVAVLDTGIDLDHPDLNVVGGTNCLKTTGGGPPWKRNYDCGDDTEDADDDHYHGTHVAGTIGAIDNDIGIVGVVPGARLYAVKVLDSSARGWASGIIAGIEWVVSQENLEGEPIIEVINMSLGGSGVNEAYVEAIGNAVEQGIVVVVAAMNADADANDYSPAFVPSAITVSALADFDGLAGGHGHPTCTVDDDDTLADFSNWGSAIDITAPGVCILSTYPLEQGGYGTISGTSMAAPHVAGAAALLASMTPGAVDVQAITNTLVGYGNFNWIDDSEDGIQEPLLDISNIAIGNSAPVANDDSASTPQDTPVTIDVLANDPDNDGDTLSVARVTQGTNGSVDINVDNTVTYTPVAGFSGPDSFTYAAYDGTVESNEATVTITVESDGGSGTPDACDGLADGVHLAPSSTNQGRTWTGIVDVVNCVGGDEANFSSVSLSWSPEPGSADHTCTTSTADCQATQSGIPKRYGTVQFTLNGVTTTVSKP